jgi:Ca-activated chloride channel family protein
MMPEQTIAAPSGLLTRAGAPVPLTGVFVDADVRALGARVTVTQKYRNTETQPIEAVYVFPLDEGAAVCGFEVVIDGVRIVGEVKEREEAFRAYDDAMAAGHGAYLLDEERSDVFQASVGNLPPGASVELTIVYVVELDVVDEAVRFAVPTTVAPRYAPAEDRVGVGRPDSEALNPPRALEVPYGLDLRVRIATPARPSRVSSPSHPIDVAFEADALVVSLSQAGTPLDRDFVLAIEGGGFEVPTAWVETSRSGDCAVAVSFVPRLPDTRQPAEIVFVVDRSGSMSGSSIVEVRNALQLCLRSMIEGCRFDIIGFGSRVETLFGKSRGYDDASLSQASEHVRALEADLGGTEILEPLRQVFSKAPAAGTVRQVVVLTDGEVTNTDAVLELVKANSATNRVFAFGIGAGASAHLVRGLARAGGGTAEFVAPLERIEPKVLRLMARLLSPAITGVRATWSGLDVVQAPAVLPPMFHGSRLVLYGFVGTPKAGSLTLDAIGPEGPFSYRVPIAADAAVPGQVVSTLAARARIRELEESPEWLRARGSRQQRGRPTGAAREIADLAIRYGLVSRETSYVAIERREVPVTGDVQLRQVPIALTHGWGSVQQPWLARAHASQTTLGVQAAMLPSARPASPKLASARFADSVFGAVEALSDALPAFNREQAASPRRPRSTRAGDALRARVLALVQLQGADGSWDPGDEFFQILRVDPTRFRAALDGLTSMQKLEPSTPRARALATATAIRWLEKHADEIREEWRLVADKGRDALTRLIGAEAGAWLDAGRSLI